MNKNHCPRERCGEISITGQGGTLGVGALVFGLLSLLWLILRTGQKPTRIQYPCQKTALANVMVAAVLIVAIIGLNCHRWAYLFRSMYRRRILIFLGVIAMGAATIGYYGWQAYQAVQVSKYYQSLRLRGPFGVKAPVALGAGAITYLTVPHAMALPSPHRVVSVHDPDASSWTYPCTSTGPCAQYYADDSFVDQAVIDQMVDRGVRELTGEDNLVSAWQAILPGYQVGETVAIKVNFNDAIAGGGAYGYADDDAFVDALPQIVNSLASGLTAIGVREEDIWVFDASRYITDRFRSRINFSGIRYFDAQGNGDDVEQVHYIVADPSADVEFSHSTYSGSHRIADLLVYADYLINVPIMKRHGGTGITLSLKNHMGSIDGFYTGVHAMHDYIDLDGSDYESNSNPLVDLNLNSNIRDKTVLIVGDAIYGGWSDNNTPPERWASFGNDSPNMLFFGADPVAVDSVLFDYLDRETTINPKAEDILLLAANAGLGVHERWNNDVDRSYQTIDYIETDLSPTSGESEDNPGDSPGDGPGNSTGDDPGNNSTGDNTGEVSSGAGSSGGCFVMTCF